MLGVTGLLYEGSVTATLLFVRTMLVATVG